MKNLNYSSENRGLKIHISSPRTTFISRPNWHVWEWDAQTFILNLTDVIFSYHLLISTLLTNNQGIHLCFTSSFWTRVFCVLRNLESIDEYVVKQWCIVLFQYTHITYHTFNLTLFDKSFKSTKYISLSDTRHLCCCWCCHAAVVFCNSRHWLLLVPGQSSLYRGWPAPASLGQMSTQLLIGCCWMTRPSHWPGFLIGLFG